MTVERAIEADAPSAVAQEERPPVTKDAKPKARVVHSELIAQGLEKEIVDGDLAAGSKLDEAAIARRFGVSRTPVREAFLLLVARSLAERVPYRGVVVCDLSVERIEEMFEAMSEIEGLCGRLAAGHMSPRERIALQDRHRLMERLAAEGRFEAFERENSELHDQIYRGTHNGDLVEIAHAMRVKLAPFRRSQLLGPERVARSNAEHGEIVQALIGRDAQGAERLLRLHLLSSAQAFIAGFLARAATRGREAKGDGATVTRLRPEDRAKAGGAS